MPSASAFHESQVTAAASAEGPSLFVDPSALNLLPGDISVLARFLQFVQRDVLQEHVPVSRMEIRGSADPEDDTSQIVVRLWIRGISENEIRQYYLDLGARVDRWTAHLSEAQRLYFFSRLSFQARREADV